MNLQPVDKIHLTLDEMYSRLSLFDYINLYPNNVIYINSAIQIWKIEAVNRRIILHYDVLPKTNLRSLFHHYVEYYDFRGKLANKWKVIKNHHLNDELMLSDELKKSQDKDEKIIYLGDLKLIIKLISSIKFEFENGIDLTNNVTKNVWSNIIPDYNDSLTTYSESQELKIQNSILGIIYFLFSLFINIYINKIYEKYNKQFSITNYFSSKSRNDQITVEELDNTYSVDKIIHNIRLPISIIQFSRPKALLLMIIVELLPYLRNIMSLNSILTNIITTIDTNDPQELFMLCVFLIILQKMPSAEENSNLIDKILNVLKTNGI